MNTTDFLSIASSICPDKLAIVFEKKRYTFSQLNERVNRLGIGPQGLGGRTTALAVHVAIFPCHIASLPVAVNINCHASRHKEIVF